MPRPDIPHTSGVVDLLRAKLNSGEYPEGSKLPGETALADQLRASRSTVRRAVAELAREGLVSAARGRGTFVRIRPERRTILIGDHAPHVDLLGSAYDPTRHGWAQTSPHHKSFSPPPNPEQVSAPIPAPAFTSKPSPDSEPSPISAPVPTSAPAPNSASSPVSLPEQSSASSPAPGSSPPRNGISQARNAQIVACGAERATALRLRPQQPIVLREERWRHQENGYLIALSSFVPTNLFTFPADAPGASASDATNDADGADSADAPTEVATPVTAVPNVDIATASTPESETETGPHRDLDVYSDLIRYHGPVTFTTSVSARMPTVRERDALEIEVGVPLLTLTRVMLDGRGRPLEATVIHAPSDRFDAAHSSRRPALSL
ncbi:GntR family transcriptional regulator [Actinospica durhamensis]|uniref:GntR family transcriptional regulator n=1 Tax=Actinospica durhamensis TaxID=1508375 RepID=A0A941EQ92_9ACTN|nr:GntR family transcriptional regulator [Actinospica durhamensis]MBR7835952.1 GntR family transcriptional regulator [Actinospica durhamensis]